MARLARVRPHACEGLVSPNWAQQDSNTPRALDRARAARWFDYHDKHDLQRARKGVRGRRKIVGY